MDGGENEAFKENLKFIFLGCFWSLTIYVPWWNQKSCQIYLSIPMIALKRFSIDSFNIRCRRTFLLHHFLVDQLLKIGSRCKVISFQTLSFAILISVSSDLQKFLLFLFKSHQFRMSSQTSIVDLCHCHGFFEHYQVIYQSRFLHSSL